MTPLCFIDTETTGLHPGRLVWEVAMIRRDETGETRRTMFIDVPLDNADPTALKIGRFYDRHPQGAYDLGDQAKRGTVYPEWGAAKTVEWLTRGTHLVGVNPAFDAGCLEPMLRRHGLLPGWHYHLIDLGAMALGYIAGRQGGLKPTTGITPPWKSDVLAAACGVEPASDRHTALGDALWAMHWYDAIVGDTA